MSNIKEMEKIGLEKGWESHCIENWGYGSRKWYFTKKFENYPYEFHITYGRFGNGYADPTKKEVLACMKAVEFFINNDIIYREIKASKNVYEEYSDLTKSALKHIIAEDSNCREWNHVDYIDVYC